ncbi:MAG: Ig domain-containing protein [Bacteroidales bacterium]|nr:Ig domain-containing protein [Bacteroidales bacterium]
MKTIRIAAALVATLALVISCKKEVNAHNKYVDVSSVSLNESYIPLIKGDTELLKATVLPKKATDKSVTWNSSATSVASVDQDGLVTAINYGTAIISVVSNWDASKNAKCTVEVVQDPVPLTGFSLSPSELLLKAGDSNYFNPIFTPANTTERKLTWHSSNESIATVDEDGKITAISKGSVTITATSKGTHSLSATATVSVVEPFTSIEVVYPNSESPSYVGPDGFFELSVGTSISISAIGYPRYGGDKLVFRSGDPDILTVSEDGLVQGRRYSANKVSVFIGSATGNVPEKELKFKVWEQPASVNLSINNAVAMSLKSGAGRPSQYIGVGCTQTFTCTVSPATAKQSVLLQSWTALFTCSMEGSTLTVTAKDSDIPSTVAEKTEGVVRLFSGGKEFAVPFIVSKYDPYQPKPGDGLFDSGTSSDRLRVIDGGWRGNDIFENSISDPSKKSRVFAMVGHIGKEWLTEDPDVTVSSTGKFRWNGIVEAADGYQRGIGIPVNASYVYASKHSAGMPFCEANANLEASYSLLGFPGLDNLKHTAYSNRQSLAAWNDAYSGNSWRYQITPFFYCDSRSTGSDGWFYGATSTTALNAKAPLECSSKTCSGWIMPTAADLFSVFNGRVPGLYEYDQEVSSTMHFLMIIMGSTDLCNEGKNRIAAFKKSAKFFSGETLDYGHWLWCSQQYDTNNGLLVIAPDNGQTQMKFESKTSASGNYVLPILYF